jgi:hypothetical protein
VIQGLSCASPLATFCRACGAISTKTKTKDQRPFLGFSNEVVIICHADLHSSTGASVKYDAKNQKCCADDVGHLLSGNLICILDYP